MPFPDSYGPEVMAVRGIALIVIGLVVLCGAGTELIGWLRSRRRLVRN